MENGSIDEAADLMKKQAKQLEQIEMHIGVNLGTLLQYRPAPALMDTV